jgi:hypothetical protein
LDNVTVVVVRLLPGVQRVQERTNSPVMIAAEWQP